MEAISSKSISCALLRHLRFRAAGCIILPNVYVGSSPWEADAIKVTKSCYWVEYEVKVSVADYRADFSKRRSRWVHDGMTKHEAYSSTDTISLSARHSNQHGVIPKPKQFYFVVPEGLLDGIDVPAHCGIIQVAPDSLRIGWNVMVTRVAPNLKSPTKLETKDIFNLAAKASHRLAWQDPDPLKLKGGE